MRRVFLLCALIGSCDPGKGANEGAGDVSRPGDGDDAGDPGDGADGGDSSDGADGGDGADGSDPLALTLDRPAFYAVGEPVLVTGVVTPAGRVASLTLDGEVVAVAADGAFSAALDLDSRPFDVAQVSATDLDGARLWVTAQVGSAEVGASDLAGGQRTEIGRDGGDALAARLSAFVQVTDFEPAAGLVLAQTTCTPCPIELECSEITETVQLTGTAVVSLAATLNPASGRLDLDVDGSTVAWGVTVVQDGSGAAAFSGDLTATVGAATGSGAALACAGLGLDVAIDAANPAWGLAPETSCIDADTLGQASGLWASHGAPGISAAACRWAPWLDQAVASGLDGATLLSLAHADTDGVHVSWDAAWEGAPPAWRAPDRASPLTPNGIDAALLDALLGGALDAAVRARLPLEITAETADGEARLRVTGQHADVATLAAVAATGGTALLAPLAYTLELDGVVCEAAHLVPAVAPLGVATAGSVATFSLSGAAAAGIDAVPSCGLDPSDHGDLIDLAVHAVTTDLAVDWRTVTGLVDDGWNTAWAPAAAGHTVTASF